MRSAHLWRFQGSSGSKAVSPTYCSRLEVALFEMSLPRIFLEMRSRTSRRSLSPKSRRSHLLQRHLRTHGGASSRHWRNLPLRAPWPALVTRTGRASTFWPCCFWLFSVYCTPKPPPPLKKLPPPRRANCSNGPFYPSSAVGVTCGVRLAPSNPNQKPVEAGPRGLEKGPMK